MTRLDQLPSELLSSIALFLGRRNAYPTNQKAKFGDLLSLRSASKAGAESVRLAGRDHSHCRVIRFSCSSTRVVSARGIAAVSKIFGGGCQVLDYTGNYALNQGTGPFPTDVVTSLRDFVVLHTRGRLVTLNISFSAITATALMDMCRASPLLERLSVCSSNPSLKTYLASNMDEVAITVSSACPLLEDVLLPRIHHLSQAESYQMHFPKTRCVSLSSPRYGGPYEPERWDKIEATVQQCKNAQTLTLGGCLISPELAGVILRGELRVTILNLELGTEVSTATILQLAAGLNSLREVTLPDTITHTPGFYVSLARARPSLTAIHWEEDSTSTLDDACIAAICENLAIERLILEPDHSLTENFIDIILASKSAQSLSDVAFYRIDVLTSANVLRLARGCPKLVDLVWYADEGLTPLADGNGQNVDHLTELLESRAKQSNEPTYFEIEVFPTYGPWKRNSHRYANY